MRVGYLLPAPGIPLRGPSGASAHARELCEALSARSDLRVFAAQEADRRGAFGPALPQATFSGAPGWPAWLGRWRELREVRAARRLDAAVLEAAARGWTPDLLIERHSLFSDAGWRLAQRLGCRLVLEVNAPPVRERLQVEELRQPALAARWEREVLQAAPELVAVSTWLVRWLRDDLGCRQVRWLPNGVPPLVGQRAAGRARLGLRDGELAVGYLGGRKRWHGVERLPGLAKALGAQLVLIGDFPDTFSGARRAGHLHGQALADAVAALDLGVAPYTAEAPPWLCPLKLSWYRAMGVPAVASDVGDCAALLDGGGGVVVPAADDGALREAARAWIGQAQPRRVRSWGAVARALLKGPTSGPESAA